jgi:hypothetical protein
MNVSQHTGLSQEYSWLEITAERLYAASVLEGNVILSELKHK